MSYYKKEKTAFNIYYGTIGKTLGYKYRFTKEFWTADQAKEFAKNVAASFYYKNEGKYGIPSFKQISEEANLTGLDIETLYQDHINDMMRWYAIETMDDSIPSSQLKW